MFSSASRTEKRGSTPKNTAASPYARCRSINSVGWLEAARSAVARLTATVVVPTPPLAPSTATVRPIIGFVTTRATRCTAASTSVSCTRLGHPLVDAHAHRFEHLARIERLRDDDDARRRELPLHLADLARQPGHAPDVEDERIGALGSERVRRFQIGQRDRRGAEPALAQPRQEAAIFRTHERDGHRHGAHLTNAMLTTKAAPGVLLVPLRGADG